MFVLLGGKARPRAFCIMSRLVTLRGKAKQFATAEAKASLNRAKSESLGVHAKRDDLGMARVKPG
jgi:hypothetical protein